MGRRGVRPGADRRLAWARKRMRWFWRDWGWLLIFGAAALVLLLGYLGYRSYLAAGETSSFWDTLYRAVQLFGLEFHEAAASVPLALQIARLAAPIVLAVAAVRAIVVLFRDQFRRLAVSLMDDHVVVCGLGTRGALLANDFKRDGYSVVAIERDGGVEGVGECREEGVVVLVGDATDEYMLRKAGIEKARYLIAVGGDDGANAEVAASAAKLVAARKRGSLEAYVHVVDSKLCALLRERERRMGGHDNLELRFFNVYEAGARAWIEAHPSFGGAGALDEQAHLVVVGVGQMGRSLVVGAVRNWLALHYATGEPGDPDASGARRVLDASGVRPRITLVDREARKEREWLLSEFPALGDFCQLIARQMEIEAPRFANADFLLDGTGRRDVTSVYVCLDDDGAGLGAALALHGRLAESDPEEGDAARIVLRLTKYAGLATLIEAEPAGGQAESGGWPRFRNLHTFEFLSQACTRAQLLGDTPQERLAREIHDEFRRQQLAKGQKPESKPSVAAWDVLRDDYKDSNRRQADHAPVKLRAVGYRMEPAGDGPAQSVEFSDDEIERMARMEHDRWTAERLFEGWRLGLDDPPRKLNPYLVPWEQLTDEIRDWDRNTVCELPEFLKKAGYSVRPIEGSS